MSARDHVDVAIIGAGTAGLAAQQEVSRYTNRYKVIEHGPLGTLCARTACMPSKALIEIANIIQAPTRFDFLNNVNVDTVAVMQHVRDLRDDFVAGVLEGMQSWRGHLIEKHACFVDEHTLDLEGTRLTVGNTIVAVGGQPVIPAQWEQFSAHLLTTDTIFELERLPSSLGVIGLGAAGIELAQALACLGVEVHGFEPTANIGGLTDPQISAYALDYFSSVLTLHIAEADITDQQDDSVTITWDQSSVQVEKALVVMGRSPALKAVGLEKLGLGKGTPAVNPSTLRLGSLPVYLVGDSNERRAVQHEAATEGRIAGYHATHTQSRHSRRWPRLAITFTTPNIAVAGRSYQELKNNDTEFVIGTTDFADQGRARMLGSNTGLLRIYAHKRDGRLLGAEMMVAQGEHLAHQIAWTIAWNKTVFEMTSLPYYHPTLEEGLRNAFADAVRQLRCNST